MASACISQIVGGNLQRGDAAEDLIYFAKQRVRFVGRNQAPAHQIEQADAKLRFGVPQNLADRWLRHIQAARSRANGTVCINGVKNFDLSQSHLGKLAAHLLRRYMQSSFQIRLLYQNSFDSSK